MQPIASRGLPFVPPSSSQQPVPTSGAGSSGAAPQFAGKTVASLPAPDESPRTAATQRAGEEPATADRSMSGDRKGMPDATADLLLPDLPFDNLVLEAPQGPPGIQWHIRQCLGRAVSPASLFEDVRAVLQAIALRGDDEDRLLGAEIARQAGGRAVSPTQLEAIIRAGVAHMGESMASTPMAWLSRFFMGVNDETRPVGQKEGDPVPNAFHAAVVSCVLREGSGDDRRDLDDLQEWCRGALQRGYPSEFSAVLKAALTAPVSAAGDGQATVAAASPDELARRLQAVMDGVAQTDHQALCLQCARSYIDKSGTFDAPTRAALQAVLARTPQPVAGGDRKASAGKSGHLGMGGLMLDGVSRPDPPLSADQAAAILTECRKSLPRPVRPDAWAARVLESASLKYGPAGLRQLGAQLARQAGGAGLEAAQREAILRACLRERAQYPYIVTVAGLRAFLVGMEGVFRSGSLPDAATFYTEAVRSIVETDPAFFGEAGLGPRRALDLLRDWSVDFTNRYPIHALRPLLAAALPATRGTASVTTSVHSSTTPTPASGPAAGAQVPAPMLAARLRAMIDGVEWGMHGADLRRLVRSYIATAGFPSVTRELLTQVLDEVLPAESQGKAQATTKAQDKAKASPTDIG